MGCSLNGWAAILMIFVGAVCLVITRREMREGWVSIRGPSLAIHRKRHPTLFWIVASFNMGAGLYLIAFGLWSVLFALIHTVLALLTGIPQISHSPFPSSALTA